VGITTNNITPTAVARLAMRNGDTRREMQKKEPKKYSNRTLAIVNNDQNNDSVV